MKKSSIILLSFILMGGMISFSCKRKTAKDEPASKKTDTPVKKDTPAAKPDPEVKSQRPPIINIVDTIAPKRVVIFSKDSVSSYDRVGLKLATIYGTKLAEYIKKNNLKMAGAPMAWYKKQKAPYFFEAGIPVNKKGTRSVTGVQIREMNIGKVVVAHFYGPYELIPQGYEAISEFIKENKKIPAGAPYEIYVTDPIDKKGKAVDPYKVQTDIVFPIR